SLAILSSALPYWFARNARQLLAAREAGCPILAAHVADVRDADIHTLAAAGVSVAYCPRAAEFFDVPRDLGPHRYRDLLDAGVNVCLGTDSLAGLPTSAADPTRGAFGPLADARRLHQRDGVDPRTLLAMATTRGAQALGLNPEAFTLNAPAPPAGLTLCRTPANGSAARGVMEASVPAQFLCMQNDARLAEMHA
ncbi:MAG: amidohydrolase family protein, partial [Planctomycetota bacterium]